MSVILVTVTAENEQRQAFMGALSQAAPVIFLQDLSEVERASQLAGADVMISWSPVHELKPDDFKKLERLKLLQLLSAGADHMPFSRLRPSLTIACNAGAYAQQMAEHVLAMILAGRKNLISRHEKLSQGIFDQSAENRKLRGSTCAIQGFGGIGKETARLLRCFGVKICGINTTGRTTEQWSS
jgi:phosphoglycerate dehydrogenase-like enzyme